MKTPERQSMEPSAGGGGPLGWSRLWPPLVIGEGHPRGQGKWWEAGGGILVAFICSVSMTEKKVAHVFPWYRNASGQEGVTPASPGAPVTRTRHSTKQ